jgi:hypothetical protein
MQTVLIKTVPCGKMPLPETILVGMPATEFVICEDYHSNFTGLYVKGTKLIAVFEEMFTIKGQKLRENLIKITLNISIEEIKEKFKTSGYEVESLIFTLRDISMIW